MNLADAAIETRGLRKRYGKRWALRDLTMAVPTGSITALVGPNGAGKSTLLRILAGISIPNSGEVCVAGQPPRSQATLEQIAYLDQARPLYKDFSVEEMLRFGRELNPRWDDARARGYLNELGISSDRRIRDLSGGQQAQVALCLCLGKRPEVLLLDEPVAALDPVAREDAMHVLLRSVVDDAATVLLSSHAIADLANVCDHVIILRDGSLALADSLTHLLDNHRIIIGPSERMHEIPSNAIVQLEISGRQQMLLVRGEHFVLSPSWQILEPTLEEIVVAHLRGNNVPEAETHGNLIDVGVESPR